MIAKTPRIITVAIIPNTTPNKNPIKSPHNQKVTVILRIAAAIQYIHFFISPLQA